MNPNLQGPLKDLAEALHRAIEQSEDVESALSSIRDAGYQAHVLVEVTVALGTADAPSDDATRQMGFADVADGEGSKTWLVEIDGAPGESPDRLADRVSDDDREFLRAIRIRIDD